MLKVLKGADTFSVCRKRYVFEYVRNGVELQGQEQERMRVKVYSMPMRLTLLIRVDTEKIRFSAAKL